MLQQIANRVQRDCVNGEDKLSLATTALQSVSIKNTTHDLYSFHVMVFVLHGFGFIPPPSLLQDSKRLEAGVQFQNEGEIARFLLECENTLRQQVVDIQMLLDGKFPFADQLVQRYNAFFVLLEPSKEP